MRPCSIHWKAGVSTPVCISKHFIKVIGRITVYLQQPSKYFIPSVAPSIKQLRSKYVSSCLHAHTLPLRLLAKLLSLQNNISLHYLTLGYLPSYVYNIVRFTCKVKSYFSFFFSNSLRCRFLAAALAFFFFKLGFS